MCSGIGFNIWTCPFQTCPYYTMERRSASLFGEDCLTARQHGHERRNLPGASGRGLHVVRAKREREQVPASEGLERPARPRVRLDRGAKVGRNRGVARAA